MIGFPLSFVCFPGCIFQVASITMNTRTIWSWRQFFMNSFCLMHCTISFHIISLWMFLEFKVPFFNGRPKKGLMLPWRWDSLMIIHLNNLHFNPPNLNWSHLSLAWTIPMLNNHHFHIYIYYVYLFIYSTTMISQVIYASRPMCFPGVFQSLYVVFCVCLRLRFTFLPWD